MDRTTHSHFPPCYKDHICSARMSPKTHITRIMGILCFFISMPPLRLTIPLLHGIYRTTDKNKESPEKQNKPKGRSGFGESTAKGCAAKILNINLSTNRILSLRSSADGCISVYGASAIFVFKRIEHIKRHATTTVRVLTRSCPNDFLNHR